MTQHLLLAGMAALMLQTGYAAEQATVDMQVQKISAHAYFVQGQAGAASAGNQGFMSNAGFVVTPDGVVVFDALGTPPLAEKLIGEIRKITAQPIRRVIVSHWHADHYYGLQAFKALGAEVWAHASGRAALASDAAAARLQQRKETLAPWVDAGFRAVPADVWLTEDSDFKFGGLTFQLRYVGPAHSPEDMVMYLKEDGVLFAGDLVFRGRVPFVGDADSLAWLGALDKLLALRPRVMAPGHGAVSTDPGADLALTRDYLRYLRSSMGRAVADLTPFDEAYAATDWRPWEKLPAFSVANRANAYNTYLLMEQEALRK
ncbi:MAG: MBL fold metallo-hydrolase [Betaproteobacteria bacterium]|nr:MBL fold metallo-hydrolase [Betaproteobacteria bacterium]